jgi:hypothetical protein
MSDRFFTSPRRWKKPLMIQRAWLRSLARRRDLALALGTTG